ncbi:hypothetical protein LTR64_001527 [Lithohypha guttulata]|uniref:uncharacterized protein n=1 Tax=Lithohypha guttulata TaxID=1690604 RepID=UPI002DE172F8|nr:hypothetical protein LTR51_003721 [Lithohypha guttulata]
MTTRTDDTEKAVPAQVEDLSRLDTSTSRIGHLANQEDHEETVSQCLRKHPVPVLWCCYGIWVILATAFDFAAPSAVIGIPQFRKDFGRPFAGNYVLPANWQAAFSGAPVASGCIGSLITGWLGEKIGMKRMLLLGFINILIGTTIQIIATTNAVFFVAKFIGGFSIGIGLTTIFSYLGEIAPTPIRGILTAASAITFVLAQLIVALILNYISDGTTRWTYRGLFCGQYAITAIAMVGLPFMPESPYWLIRHGKEEKATRALRRLGYKTDEIEKRIANIKVTLEEARGETEKASYLECFKKSNLRRTMVAVMPICIQNVGGAYFILAYLTYYAQLSGYSPSMSFKINIAAQCVSFLGCVASWPMVERFGRRPLNLYGTALLTVILWICGGLATVTTSTTFLRGAISMFIIYLFVYTATIGSTAYTALGEVATPRLRILTAAIGIILQNAIVCVLAFVIPYIFNPDKANLGGKTAFIFGGFSILSTIYMFFCHPETAGRSFEEIDEMFIKHVPARQFSSFKTDAEVRGKMVAAELKN